MDIKKIDPTFLQSFVGGIWYFRWPCFELGPDWYYLFRSRIFDIEVTENGTLELILEDLSTNRFTEGEWVEHPTSPVMKVYSQKSVSRFGKSIILPDFSLISDTIAQIDVSETGEAVMYTNESEQPDETNCFRDFSKAQDSILSFFNGLGSLL